MIVEFKKYVRDKLLKEPFSWSARFLIFEVAVFGIEVIPDASELELEKKQFDQFLKTLKETYPLEE